MRLGMFVEKGPVWEAPDMGGSAPASGDGAGASGTAAASEAATGAETAGNGLPPGGGGSGQATAGSTGQGTSEQVAEQAPSIALLGKDPTPEQRDNFYRQLGRPDDGSGYEFVPPEGMQNNPEMEKWARSAFHEAGLTGDQAKALYKSFNEMTGNAQKAAGEQAVEKVKSDFAAFKESLGKDADSLLQGADRAINNLGLSPDAVKTLRDNLGFAPLAELMVGIGKRLGDHDTGNFAGGQGPAVAADPSNYSPEQARAEIARLQADETFSKQYYDNTNPGNTAAVERMRKLFEAAYKR